MLLATASLSRGHDHSWRNGFAKDAVSGKAHPNDCEALNARLAPGHVRPRAEARAGFSQPRLPHVTVHNPCPIATHNGELFALPDDARRRHVHVIGMTGTGKTTFLKNMIADDLAAGRGVCVIEPLGHLAEAVLSLVPLSRAHDVVYVDASDLARPVGLNVMEGAHPDWHAVIADDVVSAFLSLWGATAVGDRSQQVLRNSIRALLTTPGGTLLGIPKLLIDDIYRERVVRTIEDPVVLTYWRNEFASYDERRRVEVTGPILNKLNAILSAPELRHILGQPKSTFDIRRTMDEGRILVVNLRKGRVGELNAHVLGALVVATIAQAAFAREDTPQELRRPFFVYLDEFQDFASADVKRILSQARNYGLALTLGHQYLSQLSDDLRDAVLGNAATTISFRVGAEDSEKLAAHMGLDPMIDFSGLGTHETPPETLLAKLPNFQAYGRTLFNGAPTNALHLEMYGDPTPVHKYPGRVKNRSRNFFGRERRVVEEKIRRFLEG